MADDNQLTPTIEDRCKGWTRDGENWRQCINDELEARRKAVDAQIEASAKEIAKHSHPPIWAEKLRPMRVDCSLIQGAQHIWLVAGPRLSAGRVTEVNCGEEVIARSDQDGWTKVLRQIGESPQWIEGYIGSSLLVEIPLPNDPPKIRVDRSTTSEAWASMERFVNGGSDAKPPMQVYHIGAGVSAPRALETPDPEYTREARAAKYQGKVVLSVKTQVFDCLPTRLAPSMEMARVCFLPRSLGNGPNDLMAI